MNHPFQELRPEYESLLASARIVPARAREIDAVARRLLGHLDKYAAVTAATDVPVVVLAALHERESGADFATYLGNGEPLNRVTRLVPKGRGPFLGPDAWVRGAIDAIHLDHLDDLSVTSWSMPYACWKCEAWNGFGPRNHGRHTGYLWAGTTAYGGGKYVADGVWDPNAQDKQLGTVPVMLRMIEINPNLALDQTRPIAAPGPADSAPPVAPPRKTPDGVGSDASLSSTVEIQHMLNWLKYGPLLEDGSYGRRTRESVRAFQKASGLDQDGLAGPKTISALRAAFTADRA